MENAAPAKSINEGPASVATMPPATSPLKYWLALAGCILLVKVVLLWADHAPMFFLGDSVAYLSTAKWGWIPADRSFVYGWIIRFLAIKTGSLATLLAAQMLASAATAMLAAVILRRFFQAPPIVAALAALFCAVEPLQLLYERYVMTEAFSLLAFALFVTMALAYLNGPLLRRLLLMQIAGVVLVSLRVSFLPLIEAATLLVPLLPLAMRVGRRPRTLAHLAPSLALFLALHSAYKWCYAVNIRPQLPNAPPAYYYDNGFHLLAFVGPIVQPSDFPDPAKAGEIFRVDFDLKDPQLRGKQRWWNGGLVANLQAAYPDHVEANRLAETTAWNAVKRDPWGECRLAAYGFADYWNLEHLRLGMITDRGGDRELPADFLAQLHQDFNLSAENLPHLATITNRYFYAAWPWYLALLLLPLPALAAIWIARPQHRPAAILLCVFASLQIAVIAACSITPTVRFLHPAAWLAIIIGGISFNRLPAWRLRKWQQKRGQA